MKNKSNKKAIILVYVLFLVSITVTLATVMLTSMNTLFNISTYETNEAKLLENIRND
jgi:fucose permease